MGKPDGWAGGSGEGACVMQQFCGAEVCQPRRRGTGRRKRLGQGGQSGGGGGRVPARSASAAAAAVPSLRRRSQARPCTRGGSGSGTSTGTQVSQAVPVSLALPAEAGRSEELFMAQPGTEAEGHHVYKTRLPLMSIAGTASSVLNRLIRRPCVQGKQQAKAWRPEEEGAGVLSLPAGAVSPRAASSLCLERCCSVPRESKPRAHRAFFNP